jgi:DNA-binding CsgD family transcriptional regulator
VLAFDTEELSVHRLFLSANYSRCLEDLQKQPPSAARALLSANVLVRMRRFAETLDRLAEGEPFARTDERCEAHALAARAAAGLGNAEACRCHLNRINESDLGAISPQIRARIDYHRAVCAWANDDLIEAEALLTRCNTFGDPNAEGRCKLMRSWIRAKRGRTPEQAALLVEALNCFFSSPVPDVGLMAQAAHTLSACVREVHLPEAFAVLRPCIERIPWTDDVQTEHFQTLRLAGWASALQGEYIPAIRLMQLARDIAPSPYYDVLSRFDRAWVARIAGEHASCEAEAVRAAEIALTLDWTKPVLEEAAVLAVGAEILASIDVNLASALMERFPGSRARMGPLVFFSRDPRLTALACVAQASIAQARGDVNAIRRCAKEAFDVYDGLGMEWRAALCALSLYRAGCGDEWLAIAKTNAVHYARSFIAEEIRRCDSCGAAPGAADLTARQREVFSLLNAGSSIDEIAGMLRCSPNTVRVHIGAIYRKFGVRNRIELLVRQ